METDNELEHSEQITSLSATNGSSVADNGGTAITVNGPVTINVPTNGNHTNLLQDHSERSEKILGTFRLPACSERYIKFKEAETELYQKLFEKSGREILYLNGIAGIGKTQAARKYAEQYKSDYDWILYFDTNEKAEILFYQFAEAFIPGIIKKQNSDNKDKYKAVCKEVKSYLGATDESWLIVIDHNSDENPKNYYPQRVNKSKTKHHTLIVSRKSTHQKKSIFLHGFSAAEALQFIDTYDTDFLNDDKEELARTLMYHPLAIEQALLFIENSDALSVAEYLRDYRDCFNTLTELENTEMLAKIKEDFDEDDYPYGKTLFLTLKLSLEKVYESNIDAKRILLGCSTISASKLPIFIFKALLKNFYPARNSNSLDSINHLSRSLECIRKQSLLSTLETQPPCYEMHSIIHKYIRFFCQKNDGSLYSDIEKRMLEVLSGLFRYSHTNDENWKNFESLLHHVDAFFKLISEEQFENDHDKADYSQVLYSMATYYQYRRHDYLKSCDYLRRTKRILESDNINSNLLFRTRRQLAKILSKDKNWGEAKKLYEEVEKSNLFKNQPNNEKISFYIELGLFYLYSPCEKVMYLFNPLFSSNENLKKELHLNSLSKKKQQHEQAEKYFGLASTLIDSSVNESNARLNRAKGDLSSSKSNFRPTKFNVRYIVSDLVDAVHFLRLSVSENQSELREALGQNHLKLAKVLKKLASMKIFFPDIVDEKIYDSRISIINSVVESLKKSFLNFYDFYEKDSKILRKKSSEILKILSGLNKPGDIPVDINYERLSETEAQKKYLAELEKERQNKKTSSDKDLSLNTYGTILSYYELNSTNKTPQSKSKEGLRNETTTSNGTLPKKRTRQHSIYDHFHSKKKKTDNDNVIFSNSQTKPNQKAALLEICQSWDEQRLHYAIKESLKEQGISRQYQLNQQAQNYGYRCHDVPGDGNCFFYSAFEQLPEDLKIQYKSAHALREAAADHIVDHDGIYRDFSDSENFDEFVEKLRDDGEWADQVIILALSRVLNQTIVIVRSDDADPTIIRQENAAGTLYLGYEVGLHYQYLTLDTNISNPELDLEAVLGAAEYDAANPLKIQNSAPVLG